MYKFTKLHILGVHMFNKNLRKLRKEILKMKSSQMAGLLNVPERTLMGYERKERTPPLDFALALLNTFNVNINWFLTGEGQVFLENNNEYTWAQKFAEVNLKDLKQKYPFTESEVIKLKKLINH